MFDLAYHVPERNLITQRVVSFAALFVVDRVPDRHLGRRDPGQCARRDA